jgi:hypothetical protein
VNLADYRTPAARVALDHNQKGIFSASATASAASIAPLTDVTDVTPITGVTPITDVASAVALVVHDLRRYCLSRLIRRPHPSV